MTYSDLLAVVLIESLEDEFAVEQLRHGCLDLGFSAEAFMMACNSPNRCLSASANALQSSS